jgi:diketogulonate reductase-like aldo/keto reductase
MFKPGITIGILTAIVVIDQIEIHLLKKRKNELLETNTQLALFAYSQHDVAIAIAKQNQHLAQILDRHAIVPDAFDQIVLNFDLEVEED